MRRLLPLLLLLLPLAGCFGGSDRPDYEALHQEIADESFRFLVQDHDHFRAGLHNASRNMERVGYHNGATQDGADPDGIPAGGYYTELAVTSRYAYLARGSENGTFGGFSILDVRDPAAVRLVGSYNSLTGSDIEVNGDETLAFFGTQRNEPQDILGNLAEHQDPLGTAPRSIHVVDISDKSAPSLIFDMPLPVNGPHTFTYHEHANGNAYLLVSTYDLVTEPGTGALLASVPVTQRVLVYRVQAADEAGDVLVPVNEYQILETAPEGRLHFPHDVTVQVHPNTQQTLMYVAYWDKGVQIVDFSDPEARPLPHVSGHTEFGPSSRNSIHQVRPFDGWITERERHVTVAEPEIVSADETGYITFLDTSDPLRPEKLGHWTLPGELVVQDLEFSPHNFDTFDSKVALAHNHAGLWVIDVSDEENLQAPKSVGYYLPDLERQDAPRPQPYFWGVFEQPVVVRGEVRSLLFASDEATGLHIVEYAGP